MLLLLLTGISHGGLLAGVPGERGITSGCGVSPLGLKQLVELLLDGFL